MDIRYSANPVDVIGYATQDLRDEFLITDLYKPDSVVSVYSHSDRLLVLGIMPINEVVPISKDMDILGSFGTEYFLERREVGIFNLGDTGVCIVDGKEYTLGNKDSIYITRGAVEVVFKSVNPKSPARFYGISAPAHRACETKLITLDDAIKIPMGGSEAANKRVIYQFIHPDVVETCQLVMGMTCLEQGSVWNSMPTHMHERRTEVYTYFDLPEENAVFHLMGEADQTRHLVMKNGEAVISPSWSLHAGCGTVNYSFIWAMGGENQNFADMDGIKTSDLR